MVRSRFVPWLAALAALLAAPQLAPAGPLSWGFRAETPEGVVLRDVTGLTDSYYGDHFLADPQFYGTYQGSVIGAGFRSESWETAAWLTITDETSGVSGESRVWWRWVKEYDRRPDGSEDQIYEGYISGPWNEPARLTLGAHVYEVRGVGGDMQVSVTPFVPVAAPEPATLALAGVGLVPPFARVARRRMTRCA
jgi:hypothetical protein